jgi:hypothetical protein
MSHLTLPISHLTPPKRTRDVQMVLTLTSRERENDGAASAASDDDADRKGERRV